MADRPEMDAAAFKQFEHDGWRQVSDTYNEGFGATTRQAVAPLLDAVGIQSGESLLDVACGPGMMAAQAAQRGAAAVGLDYVAGMVEEARRLHPGVEFRQGDAESLPFEDGTFDAVVCGFGILHFPDPDRAIAEAHRVLKPGGRYALTCWCPPERSPKFRLLMDAIREHGDVNVPLPPGPPLFRFADPAECESVLTAAGFSGVACSELPLLARFSAPAAVLDYWYKGSVRTKALLLGQTPENRRRIEAAMVAGVRQFSGDGGIVISQPALLVSAHRP